MVGSRKINLRDLSEQICIIQLAISVHFEQHKALKIVNNSDRPVLVTTQRIGKGRRGYM